MCKEETDELPMYEQLGFGDKGVHPDNVENNPASQDGLSELLELLHPIFKEQPD